MYGLAASILFPIVLALLIFQSVRADGFLWWEGLSDRLEACQTLNDRANAAAKADADRAREEGRISAEADAKRLLEEEVKRREGTDKTIAELRRLVDRLRPQPVVVREPGAPPIVVTPPALPRECRLNQDALDGMRATVNRQRGLP